MQCWVNHRHPRCISRGNLIINGSFEDTDPLHGWIANDGVDSFAAPEEKSHQGYKAARLGYANSYAYLYQDVPGISSGCYYQFNCYLIAGTSEGNAPIWVAIRFLNSFKQDLGPGLDFIVETFNLSDQSYVSFLNTTTYPAPASARYARISFEVDTSDSGGYVDLDDVSLIAI